MQQVLMFYGTNQLQLKRHAHATRNKNTCQTRVHAKFVFCVCLRVLSLNFSIIVSRHFKVINRTLQLLTYHVAMYLNTVPAFII